MSAASDDKPHTDLNGLMADEFRETRRELPAAKRVLVPVLVLAVLVAVAVGLYPRRPVIERENLAATYAHIAPFSELHALEDGWVGEVASGWAGQEDPAAYMAACRALARELRASPIQTLTLLDASGEPLADCTGSSAR